MTLLNMDPVFWEAINQIRKAFREQLSDPRRPNIDDALETIKSWKAVSPDELTEKEVLSGLELFIRALWIIEVRAEEQRRKPNYSA